MGWGGGRIRKRLALWKREYKEDPFLEEVHIHFAQWNSFCREVEPLKETTPSKVGNNVSG